MKEHRAWVLDCLPTNNMRNNQRKTLKDIKKAANQSRTPVLEKEKNNRVFSCFHTPQNSSNQDLAFPDLPSTEGRPDSHIPPQNWTRIPLATSGGDQLEGQTTTKTTENTLLPYLAWDSCFLPTDAQANRGNHDPATTSSSVSVKPLLPCTKISGWGRRGDS
jgi:hypothetical protein